MAMELQTQMTLNPRALGTESRESRAGRAPPREQLQQSGATLGMMKWSLVPGPRSPACLPLSRSSIFPNLTLPPSVSGQPSVTQGDFRREARQRALVRSHFHSMTILQST
jgi:hypothetical protein